MKQKTKGRMLLFLFFLLIIFCVGYVWMTSRQKDKGGTENTETQEEKEPTEEETEEELLRLNERAKTSEISCSCKFPKAVDKMEKCCFGEKIHAWLEEDTKAKVEKLLENNSWQQSYSLTVTPQIGDPDFIWPTEENPFHYSETPEEDSWMLCKGVPGDMSGSFSDFNQDKAEEAFEEFLQAFSLQEYTSTENADISYLESNPFYYYDEKEKTPPEEKNYIANYYQQYNDIPIIAPIPEEGTNEKWGACPHLELQFGEYGWIKMSGKAFREVKGTGEYITEFLNSRKAVRKVEEYICKDFLEGHQDFEINSISLVYGAIKQDNIVALWRVRGTYQSDISDKQIRSYYVNCENGAVCKGGWE